MNINQLIEQLPEHPLVLMQNALGRKVSLDFYYLYRIIKFYMECLTRHGIIEPYRLTF